MDASTSAGSHYVLCSSSYLQLTPVAVRIMWHHVLPRMIEVGIGGQREGTSTHNFTAKDTEASSLHLQQTPVVGCAKNDLDTSL